MNDYGLVSIVMPAYNASAYIRKSIQSIQHQTYENWELLIVEDCSKDDTLSLINELAVSDSRIKIFVNDVNSGAALSRNKALREASGKWVAFLDGDDLWMPEKLERQLNFMVEHNYKFSYTDYMIQYNGTWLPYRYTGPEVVDKRKMYNYCYFSTITVMYDREYVGLVQIADLKKNNDYAMWLKVIEKCNCYRMPECLSFYIKHDDSISSGSKLKLIKWHYRLFRIGMERGVFISSVLTLNNLFHGVIKKMRYKEKVESIPESIV